MHHIAYRELADFPGYRIGTDGTPWSCRSRWGLLPDWSPLKPEQARNGYLYVTLSGPWGRSRRTVHSLVLEAFRGPRPAGMEGCHDDGDPLNNSLDNLYWGTKSQNQLDRWRHGTMTAGERNPKARLTDREVALLRSLRLAGRTEQALATLFHISPSSVHDILSGRTRSSA